MSTKQPFVRPGCDPASLYLAQLAPGSRRVMTASLHLIADTLSRGEHDAFTYPWAGARYLDAARLRSWLCDNYSPATVGRVLVAWRCVLRETFRLGLLGSDDFLRARDIRAPRQDDGHPRRLLSPAEVAALLSFCGTKAFDIRDVALVAVLAGTGVRRQELSRLQVGDYDVSTGTLTVRCGKGGRRRDLLLHVRLRPHLERWLRRRGPAAGPLFCAISSTGRVLNRPPSGEGVTFALKRLATRAGVEPFSPHVLRRWFASSLLNWGVDLLTVQALLGHAPGTTTISRYDLRAHGATGVDALWEEITTTAADKAAAA